MRQKPTLPFPFDRPRSIACLVVAAVVAAGIGWQRADAQPGPTRPGAKPAAGPSAQAPPARAPAAGPAAALPLTPKDAKTIQLLERFAADEKLAPAGRIEQIAKTGLGPAAKNPAVRAAARRLLAGIAAESPEGALAMIEEAQAGLSKGITPRLSDTLVVALRIVPETEDDGAPDPATTLALAALVQEIDEKAGDSQKMNGLLADVARGVGWEGGLDGDAAPAVQALEAIVAMKAFRTGTEKDPRGLGLMEGVIDGLAVTLRAPKAFDLLLNKVWPKLDKEPRLEKDCGGPGDPTVTREGPGCRPRPDGQDRGDVAQGMAILVEHSRRGRSRGGPRPSARPATPGRDRRRPGQVREVDEERSLRPHAPRHLDRLFLF